MMVIQTEKGPVVWLTEGNLKILSALEKWGILGLGQVDGLMFHKELNKEKRMELFFNSVTREDYSGTAYKGMDRLKKAGCVRGHSYTNLPTVYTLTSMGHGVLRKNQLSKLTTFCGEVAETLVRHELTVSAAGLVMTELLGLRVWTEMERYLMSSVGNRTAGRKDFGLSDLWIQDAAQPKAVEIERTQKSAGRYAELWDNYRIQLPPNGVVLYVVCFPGGTERLLRRAEQLRADHVYFCALENFKESLGTGPFVGYRGGRIMLGGRA